MLEGTRISKSIDADAFSSFYKDGDTATLGGCVALQRDTDALTDATDIVDSTGLRFDGSKFVDESGTPQTFYIVDGELMPEQPYLVVRVSATTDGVEISPTVAEQFELKHPDYKYNGYSISDNSSGNNTYLNEIWNRNRDRQVGDLAEHSGIARASVTFSSDNKRFKRTPKSDKVLGDQTKKL